MNIDCYVDGLRPVLERVALDAALFSLMDSTIAGIKRGDLAVERQGSFAPYYPASTSTDGLLRLMNRSSIDGLSASRKDSMHWFQFHRASEFIAMVGAHFSGKEVLNRGRFVYAPGGYMSWHTNADAPGLRVGFSWAAEDGKATFGYRDPATGKIGHSLDAKGWNIRAFYAGIGKDSFWHSMKVDTERYFFGSNVR